MALTTRPKLQPHHKKARGDHHRQGKHYLKAYAPYLPLLLIVIVGLAINSLWTARVGVLGASTSLSAMQLLQSTNQARATHGQDGLKLNSALSAAAQAKASDMVSRGYWSHITPDGKSPWSFMTKSGYQYNTAGENLAYGFSNADGAITGWMNSPEHRANLLGADYTEVGFGIMPASNFQNHGRTTIIVAMYAQPAMSFGATSTSSATTDQPSEIPLRNVSRIQQMTHGDAPWSLAVLSFLSFVAVAWFFYRHLKVWHRVVISSEEFIVHHKFLDVIIVATAVAGFVMTRTVGFIH